MERRDPRRRHAGGVHPAHRPRRTSRHRHRGQRRRRVAPGLRPRRARRARVDAHLSAALVVQAVVQHGGQPRRVGRATTPRASCSRRRSRSSRPTARSSASPSQVRKQEEAIDGYREAMVCHLGDFEEYAELRRQLTDREKELARDGAGPSPRGRGRGVARGAQAGRRHRGPRRAPLRASPSCSIPGLHERDEPRPTVLLLDRQVKRLSVLDFPAAVEPLESIRIPKLFNPRSANSRRDLAATAEGRGRRRPGRPAAQGEGRHGRGRPRPRAAPPHPPAPVPRLRRARAARALGRALPPAAARDPWPRAPGRVAHELDRAPVRPGLRHPRPTRLPHRRRRLRDRHGRGAHAPAPLQRHGPRGRGVPAPGDLGGAHGARSSRPAPRRSCSRPGRPTTPRRRACPAGGSATSSPRPSGCGASSPSSRPRRRSPFLREPDLGFAYAAHRWASGQPPRVGPARRRPRRRRLRALVQAARRPPRPDRRRRGIAPHARGHRAGAHRPRGRRLGEARRGGLLVGLTPRDRGPAVRPDPCARGRGCGAQRP